MDKWNCGSIKRAGTQIAICSYAKIFKNFQKLNCER